MIVVYSIANHIKKQQNLTKSSIKIYVSFIITFFILENKEKNPQIFRLNWISLALICQQYKFVMKITRYIHYFGFYLTKCRFGMSFIFVWLLIFGTSSRAFVKTHATF